MPHVAEWKKDEVANLKDLINSYEVVGMANLADIPAPQLQQMRRTLKDSATLKMSRKTLMSLALNDSEKAQIENLEDYMEGQPALIFTNMNPFKLYKILESSKTPAPAKAGSIAPEDIIVPKGDTAFKPGPVLGELQKAGIPAKIEKGKIVITNDKVIVEAGEVIPRDVASILTRLEIFPLEVGIDLRAAYEAETIYTSDLLTVDEEKTLADVQKAFTQALNLSVEAVIFNKESTPLIIQKAVSQSLNLALNAEILNEKTRDVLLAKAYAQMLALASEVSAKDENAVDDELKEKLSSTAAKVETPEDNNDEPEDEEEAEEEEGDAAAGLGALFG
ncbi:Acidic ribosomal protein P0-like protein [Methanobacterium lacus]|jgi:large subunit ribosomal protein L10|uniref:Large ribosomal subunit protein uL10 n=1 Tax=Methanobacterium lacus (strain AL-21) TaxID=877455 RepID=F0TCS6_METLA|nr:50S ribosomal protein L10 [Methanobacterium lacus]ADZ10466.1 Acidic ribosomal protein P0-like protein [Methanobacterium lacus]